MIWIFKCTIPHLRYNSQALYHHHHHVLMVLFLPPCCSFNQTEGVLLHYAQFICKVNKSEICVHCNEKKWRVHKPLLLDSKGRLKIPCQGQQPPLRWTVQLRLGAGGSIGYLSHAMSSSYDSWRPVQTSSCARVRPWMAIPVMWVTGSIHV